LEKDGRYLVRKIIDVSLLNLRPVAQMPTMCDLQPRLSELLKDMHSVKNVSAKVSAKTLKFGNGPTARPNSGDLFNKQKNNIKESKKQI